MAFQFDSTPKSATANSYISVEAADDMAYGLINGQSWLDLASHQKQALLVQATSRLDIETWGGAPTSTEQHLQWPRNWITNRSNGTAYLDADTIPATLEKATFALAMHYLDEFLGNPTVSRQDMDRLNSMTIGPLSVTLQQRSEEKLPDLVTRMLRAIGSNAWMTGTPGANPSMIKLVR